MNGSQRRPLIWSWPPHPGSQRPIDKEDPEEKMQTGSANSGAKVGQLAGLEQETPAATEKKSTSKAAQAPGQKKAPANVELKKATETSVEMPVEGLAPVPPEGALLPVPEERIPAAMEGHYPMPGHCPGVQNMRLARSYVPCQRFGPTYSPREALEKGTLFPDLYFPYPY